MSFLPGQEFLSLDSANEQVRSWVRDVADQRIHGTVHEKPAERFKRENLRPLGNKPPYLMQTCQLRKVAIDCLVSYKANCYSVPWQYVNQTVEIQEGSNGWLCIYHKGTLIAKHLIAEQKHQVIMDKEHYRGLSPKWENIAKVKLLPEVQVRSLEVYESLVSGGALIG
ncbi:hypothetical protein Psch_04091 [Pelotomaculum schinkii]|uniref:Transposase for insertion sequence element IS21-like C-terminal domain-containing protein n=1 Tax=Pelotomaculum schinkii TaxID=78350 RepID=A0A4Y7R5X4_9FIRM|nr:hypothetical protein [Pelotomaculum schinkii]TEB04364.1 hypothetical protein Psch_04091 [Pelotomaculum schinkii]